jgi:drug/metabolite transporter (DMT)-like permease
MAFLVVRRIDLLAVGAAVVAVSMTAVYRGLVESQGDESPLWWVQAALVLAALLALAGAPTGNPRRGPVLLAATGLLAIIGLLGILTIGLPILCAAALTFVAAVRDLSAAPKAPAAPSS